MAYLEFKYSGSRRSEESNENQFALSKREMKVLLLVAIDKSNKEVKKPLSNDRLSAFPVKWH